jgi:hypothetical protein
MLENDESYKNNFDSEATILQRAWFCSPEWPPADYDSEEKLKFLDLRVVSLLNWETEPSEDSNGKFLGNIH